MRSVTGLYSCNSATDSSVGIIAKVKASGFSQVAAIPNCEPAPQKLMTIMPKTVINFLIPELKFKH